MKQSSLKILKLILPQLSFEWSTQLSFEWSTQLSFRLMIGSFLILAACAKSGDSGGGGGGGGGTVATTPTACNNIQGAGCDPSIYGQQPGLMIPAPQAYSNGYNNGYCGCQTDYRPIYSQQWGFACAPSTYMTYNSYVGYNFNSMYQGQNYAPNTINQVYYSPATYGGANNCYQNFAQSCDVRVASSCGGNSQCRAIGGGSTIGVCTTGYGVDAYNGSNSYPQSQPYYPGYYGGGGSNYSCRTRTNSWGLSYYYCGPRF